MKYSSSVVEDEFQILFSNTLHILVQNVPRKKKEEKNKGLHCITFNAYFFVDFFSNTKTNLAFSKCVRGAKRTESHRPLLKTLIIIVLMYYFCKYD